MIWLEAAMAFCVVMMVLSTMVTVLVESFYHRLFKLRQRGMRQLVAALYEDIIKPRLAGVPASASQFSKDLTTLRYMPFSKQLSGFSGWFRQHWHCIIVGKEVQAMTALEFIARFAQTPAGKALAERAEALAAGCAEQYVQDFLDDLVAKFNEYGNNTRDYFAKRAQMVSVLFSILLVVMLNLNVIDVFNTVLKDDKIRQQLLAQSDLVALAMQQQQRSADQAVAQLQTTESPAQAISTAEGSTQAEKSLTEASAQLQHSLRQLQDAGLPFGEPWPAELWAFAERALLVIFSGLLVGLGGPFWFDTFRKLSSIAGVARAVAASATEQEAQPQASVAGQTPYQVYQKALSASLLADPAQYAGHHQQQQPK